MSAPLMDPSRAADKYEHGTRARYHLGKCRCFPCKVANSEYEHERLQRRRNPWRVRKVGGKWVVKNIETGEIAPEDIADELLLEQPEDDAELISTREAVKHMKALQRAGVGLKTVAKRAGVPYSVIQRMMPGADYRPILRTRRSTAEKILSVSVSAVSEGARIDSSDTVRLLETLYGTGYRRYWVARELGFKSNCPQIKSYRPCTVRNAKKVHELYVRLMRADTRLPRIDPEFVVRNPLPSSAMNTKGAVA